MASYEITKEGVAFYNFQDILRVMESKGKEIFGDEFKIDPDTSIGQFFEIFAHTLEPFSGGIASTAALVSVYTQAGQHLDSFASSFSIERIQGSKSYGFLKIKGKPGTVIKTGTQFECKSLKYETTFPIQLNDEGIETVQIQAVETGINYDVEENATWKKVVADESIENMTNENKIEFGGGVELDVDFRERIIDILSRPENSSVQGITNALQKQAQVKKVKVYENNTDVYDPILGLEPTELKVFIDGIIDEKLANVLKNARSAGIRTIGNRKFDIYQESGQKIVERLNTITEIFAEIKIKNIQMENGFIEDLEKNIKNEFDYFFSKLDISENLNYEKIIAIVFKHEEIKDCSLSLIIDGKEINQDVEISIGERIKLKDVIIEWQ